MTQKRKRPLPLGRGHRENPWKPVHPTEAELVVAAMTSNRQAHHDLLNLVRALETPDICHWCGCTDEAGCTPPLPPCRWINRARTKCSNCVSRKP